MTLARTTPVAAPASAASVRWLPAWAAQRFPLKNLLFFGPLHLAALAAARAGSAFRLGGREVLQFGAFWSFFLVLRVLDEHKDFAADAVAHPDRVLQRGLVSLAMLRGLAVAALALQLGVSLWSDGGRAGPATLSWLAAIAWSALMAREFFAPGWLRARIVVYALSHMLVMPLLIVWAAAMAGAPPDARVGAVALLAFAGGLAVEIARKLRAPEDERPTADSYTQSLGIGRAVMASLGTLAFATAVAPWASRVVSGGVSWPALAVLLLVALHATVSLVRFRRAPSARTAGRLELATGGAVLAGLACVVASAVGVAVR